MDEMEEKLGAILGNPQMMQQIMAMAQTLGQTQPQQQPPPPPTEPRQQLPTMGLNMDPANLQRIAGLLRQSGIDKNQQSLLKALGPYLSRERIIKLEKAMRAAKIAAMASTFLRNGGLNLFGSR